MICRTCNANSSRIIVLDGHDLCTNCGGFSNTGGSQMSGALTRNAFRIREQQASHQADFIQPDRYDKATRKLVPNEDFINYYPDQVHQYYEDDVLERKGYAKLAKHSAKIKRDKANNKQMLREQAQHMGSAKNAIDKA